MAFKIAKKEFPVGKLHNGKASKLHRDWEANGIMVSDHAVVRFLEICGGMDMRLIRETIIDKNRAKVIRKNPTCKVPISDDGAKLVVREGVVVTVIKRRNDYVRTE